ncbi:uncharacterized protein LOC121385765 [Gigantopelta aegis]|uniref:uncharacterized protein LOC121385765 n=1 Tax=Gigantopelta aegis TaxID=1735272 RepID=UPI001B887924|nr:uncharacterized protein LOC121385765 [Gigantopelta aegis]
MFRVDAPTVTVRETIISHNKTVRVICEANGNPAEYTFSNFTHSRNGHSIGELEGAHAEPNKYVLTISPYSYNDTGTYQCTVSNGIAGINNATNQTGNITITIEMEAMEATEDTLPREILILVASGVAGLAILLTIVVVACIINKRANSAKDQIMEDINIYGRGAEGPSVSFGHEDISDMYSVVHKDGNIAGDNVNANPPNDEITSMYSVVNKDGRNAGNNVNTNPAEGDISSMYAVVNKGHRSRAEDENTMAEDELSSTYAVVKKTKKSGDKAKKGKKAKATPDDGAVDIYAQVDKTKTKGKKQTSAEQNDETEPQAVGNLNTQAPFCSVYEAI